MNEKKRFSTICSWCQHCITGQDTGRRPPMIDPPSGHSTYCLNDHFDNDGLNNYPEIKECSDYEFDKTATLVDAYWWPLVWATKEIERLNDKLAIKKDN